MPLEVVFFYFLGQIKLQAPDFCEENFSERYPEKASETRFSGNRNVFEVSITTSRTPDVSVNHPVIRHLEKLIQKRS